ncbi:MAG: ATP-binding protein, partial [Lachnospiraceae bacterium]|nr:ATP-binding protein [Lachnospiraceae bacterium]
MKLLKITMEGLPHFKDMLDIDFVARQRVHDDDKERLCNVFSTIYVNQVISFVGINASGKTTILKALSFAMKMLNNESINNIPSKEVLNDLEKNQKVIITAYFYSKDSIHKLETCIEKKVNDIDESEKLVITDENLWSKEICKVKTKKSMFDFQETDLKEKRNQDEQYLMEDISIMVAINKKNDSGYLVRDMLVWTDHNMLSVLGKFPKELLT